VAHPEAGFPETGFLHRREPYKLTGAMPFAPVTIFVNKLAKSAFSKTNRTINRTTMAIDDPTNRHVDPARVFASP
jgi:hypothetical protein